jgi:hypothetical protein
MKFIQLFLNVTGVIDVIGVIEGGWRIQSGPTDWQGSPFASGPDESAIANNNYFKFLCQFHFLHSPSRHDDSLRSSNNGKCK